MSGESDTQVESVQLAPVWGENYRPGYIGFTWHRSHPMHHGIAWFTRFARLSAIRVAHVFIVSGEDECVEALSNGVSAQPLQRYFADPLCAVFFRKPRNYSPELGHAIAATAKTRIGCRYDWGLVAAHALANLWAVQRLMSKGRHRNLEKWLAELGDSPKRNMCSELAAFSLDEQPQLRDLGCLAEPHRTISPQELFEDLEVFEPWHTHSPEFPNEYP